MCLFVIFYQPYETYHSIHKNSVDIGTRLTRHTEICGSCTQAYQVTKQVKQTLVGVAIALAALGIVLDHSWIQILVVSACGVGSTFGSCSRESED